MKKKKTEPRFVATSIQLLTPQFEALSRMKIITGKSISVLIREAVERYINPTGHAPARSAAEGR